MNGTWGRVLEVNLSDGTSRSRDIPAADYEAYMGGRGLGMKLLADLTPEAGRDARHPDTPLLFMPGPCSGYPFPSSSRTCVVTKSPCTSPLAETAPGASTVSYSNIGGFLGPEIRFAGYDGLLLLGQASTPVNLVIDGDKVDVRDASAYWGMGTDAFDQAFQHELGDRRFCTATIGQAGENQVHYACILHTAARAAGRGVGCVMGAKRLKGIAVRGTQQPPVADHAAYLAVLDKTRHAWRGPTARIYRNILRRYGTAWGIESISKQGRMAVKNYREGSYEYADDIGGKASLEQLWTRDFACHCCQLSCKKSGSFKSGKYQGIVHDGPEYETGTLFGANLLIHDLPGLMQAIYDGDDYGMDIISAGNTIGFLMECYEKGLIDRTFLDGIDLVWGDVDAVISLVRRIALREGIGYLASQGVKAVAAEVGQGSEAFANHVKGLEFAAHNLHVNPPMALSYATSNRGACHLAGHSKAHQDFTAATDSTGVCLFAAGYPNRMLGGLDEGYFAAILTALTGTDWDAARFQETGERIYNLERAFNCREGFRRDDDAVPARFFDEPLTFGKHAGGVLDRGEFKAMLDTYYAERGWDPATGVPQPETLQRLGLS